VKYALLPFLLFAAVLLRAETVLPPDTPVFAAPAHNSPIIAVFREAVTLESLPPDTSIIAKHPLARYFDFTPVRLPDGRAGFADTSVRLRAKPGGGYTLVFSPYRPLWRDLLLALTALGLILLGYDWYRKKKACWFHWAGIPALVRILLVLIVIQRAGNLIASPMDEVGYYANLASFLKGDFSTPWHFTVGTSILYAPFALILGARHYGDIAIPFSLFAALVLAPGMLVLGYFVGKKLTGSAAKSSLAMLLWAVWPFFNHHFAGFGIKRFWSYFALPSANFDFAHYVNLIGASYNGMSDTPSTFAVLGVMAIVLYGRPKCHTAAVAGLLYGFACTIRINNILFAPVLMLMVLYFQRPLFTVRACLTAGAAFVLGFLPQFAANTYFFGSPLRFSYTNYAGGAHTYLHWVFFRLTAAYYGAANHVCWSLAAAALLWMRDRKLRLLFTVWAVPVILFFTLYSHGTDDAIRFVLTSYPAMFLAITSCGIWETLSKRGWGAAAAFFAVLACFPPNATDAGRLIWYPWRTTAAVFGVPAVRSRAMGFFATAGLLYLFGNGYILIALLTAALVYAAGENLYFALRRDSSSMQ